MKNDSTRNSNRSRSKALVKRPSKLLSVQTCSVLMSFWSQQSLMKCIQMSIVFLCWIRFLTIHIVASLLHIIEVLRNSNRNPATSNCFQNQIIWEQQLEMKIYSASAVDVDIFTTMKCRVKYNRPMHQIVLICNFSFRLAFV